MSGITLLLSDAEIERLVELDLQDRRRLCNPATLDAAFVTLANIAARAELARVRREVARRAIRKTIKPFQLPLEGFEAA